jgi:hypothetical protein
MSKLVPRMNPITPYAATYYVNDDLEIADGDILIGHDKRRFIVSVLLLAD